MPPETTPARCRIIALTGFMGAGKTTVGAALAEHLGWQSVDLDAVIEAHHNRTIAELFAAHGEARFRELESAMLLTVLERAGDGLVLALGGGTFVQPENARLLQARFAQIVFLETPLEAMLARCCPTAESGAANPRPLAADPEAFGRLYEQRLPAYRTAHLTVTTTGKSAAELAREIAERLHSVLV